MKRPPTLPCVWEWSESILKDEKTNQIRGIPPVMVQISITNRGILTTGTFLNGKVHIGQVNYSSGRQGEEAVTNLSLVLNHLGLQMGRLKTGTPPRLLKSSIDFCRLEYQQPDNLNYLFEFYPHKTNSTHACYITHTNEKTHEIIRKNLHLSAMYSGNIKGIGPRYCPSIEDKIGRFADKTSHHIFVEPEGATRKKFTRMEFLPLSLLKCKKNIFGPLKDLRRPLLPALDMPLNMILYLPDQLRHRYGSQNGARPFFAGQINGTTGYEEAAGQGIIAGINAHLKQARKDPFILQRTESYIGVMIDDLVSLSVDEPYRMFTSRAERRLLLRQDNAFLRLTDRAYALGLIEQQLYQDFKQEKEFVHTTLESLRAGNNNAALLKLFGDLECDVKSMRMPPENCLIV